MLPSTVEGYEFGPFGIDTGERLLRRDGELVPLPPKVASTLLVLLQSAGRMVDKADLMKAVWPDTFVEDGAVARNISILRKTLGDTGEVATFIETIPKRGYRFVAAVRTVAVAPAGTPFEDSHEATRRTDEVSPVREDQAKTKRPAWRLKTSWVAWSLGLLAGAAAVAEFTIRDLGHSPAPPTTAAANALAVMPFRAIQSDGSQDYIADGMTQALVTRLARLRKLRVISLASEGVMPKDAAAWNAILGIQSVSRVLTGSVSFSGGRLRIDAQLLDPKTKAVHWANSYERKLEDILALESEISEAIAGEIQINITDQDRERLRQRRTAKPEAVDAYLRGRYFLDRRTEEGLRRAADCFQEAIGIDPGYALAYTGLADSYSLLGSIGTDGLPPRKSMPLAKAAALKAIELEPDLADGHISLAYVMLSYDWNLPGASREFSRALELNPNSPAARHWYSHYFMAAGDLNRAAEQMQEAVQLEPLSPSINIGVGWCLYYSRRYDEAIERFRSVAERWPALPLAHQTLGMAYQQKGMIGQAIEEYNRAAALSSNSPASVSALASAYASAGRTAEARQELARLEEMARSRYVPAFYFASIHYAMGDLARTFEWGWKAIGERCDYLMYLRVEPRVGKLAGNPEFIRGMAALHR